MIGFVALILSVDSSTKLRATRNRTLTLTDAEQSQYARQLLRLPTTFEIERLADRILCANATAIFSELPHAFADLLILDPPYNLTKKFGSEGFSEMSLDEYEAWFESWFTQVLPCLKRTGSLYVCGDWRTPTTLRRSQRSSSPSWC